MKTRILFLALTVIICMPSCLKTRKTADPSEFAQHITGYTTGIISKTETIRIRLAGGNLKFETGKPLPAGVLTFDPSVKGTASLYSEDMLIFKPETEWPAGKTITATLDLQKIMDVPDRISNFDFQFSILSPSFSVYPGNLISFGEKDRKMKKIEGRLISADVMDLEDVKKLLKASSEKENFVLNWEEGAGKNEFNFVVDSIPRTGEPIKVVVEWDGSPLDIDVSGSYTFEIPSIYDFLYLGANAGSGENQYLDIVLSDPVDPAQDLTGLIYLAEGDAIRLVADNNIIRLYPLQRLEGERTLIIETSLRSDALGNLKSRVEEKIMFEELKPAAEFIGQGVIMPDPEGLFLPIRTVSLRAVDVLVYKIFENNIPYYLQENNFSAGNYYNFKQFGRPVYAKTIILDEDKSKDLKKWNSYSLDLAPLMKEDQSAVYRVKLNFRKEYALFDCNTDPVDISGFILDGTFPEDKIEAWDKPGWYSEYDWPDDYNWNERDNPCHDSYYISDKFNQKLILASKIGVTAKSADGKNFIVYATDLVSGEPAADVDISFFNYQNQPVGIVKTGSEGGAEVRLESRPFFLKASKEKQQTWLRLDDGSSLSMSHFDVSGEEVQKGLKGMIYGERGVWRPGDTLFLSFILDDTQNELPDGYPVQFEVTNSRGQMAYSTKNASGTNGFYIFKVPTDPEAPTGTWRAKAKVGGAFFEKNLKIETVKPNRLKIKLDFNQEVLSRSGAKPEGSIEVRWLHGAVAPGIKVDINLSFRKSKTVFKGYEKYTFDNPATYFWAEERNVFDKELDNQGRAKFNLELPQSSNAPGMMDAVFLVRAFEKGGDFSTDVFTRQFSSYERYIGIHVPDGGTYQDMLETDQDHRVDIASVDWKGNPVNCPDLQVRVYRIGWRWWWSSGDEDLAYYVGNQDAEIIYQGKVDAVNGKGYFNLRINYPDWGRYLILVKDPEGQHQAGITVYYDWPSYVNRSGRANPAGATMLAFSADKEKYQVGDKAVISFPATPGSRALISIESGSKVVASEWKMCNKAEETFEIPISKGMAPNVYVYLSLIQPHKQTVNDLPIRMYGVIPLMIEDPATVLDPVISMPAELKPEENFTVQVSEKDGKAMTFTIAVVDDGLLDLTRYKTPDPHSVFYAREALGVKTWDMYDLVLGAFGGRLEKALAIGGDDAASMAKNKKAQRFVPVVKYAGPFTINKGEKKEISLKMPNYVGSVRTMVVAAKDGAYGKAEKTVPVRKPLMVLVTLPRVLGPGEELELPVTVFAMTDNVKKADVKVEADGKFTMLSSSQQLSFAQPGEQMAFFRMKVNDKPGIAKIKVTATSGNETAYQEYEIEVRNPNPVIARSESYVIEPGQSLQVPYNFFGMEGTNSGQLTLSGLPEFDLDRHLSYLVQYPYGCLEQTVSCVFPQLYLSDLCDISQERQLRIDRNIRAAIDKIAKMNLSDGSFTYWPGQLQYDRWTTSYAGHFLMLASEKGYLLPSGLLEKWLEFQYRTASNYQPDFSEGISYYSTIQAYRLYTLAIAQKPNMGAMNRMRESGNLSPTSAWILAAAYVYAGKPEAANLLVSGMPFNVTDKYDYAGYTYGSGLRDKAFILEVLTMLDKENEAFRLMEEMAKELKSNYYSTQTTAFCLASIVKYAGKNTGKGVSFDYSVKSENKTVNTLKSVYSIELNEKDGLNGAVQVKNNKPDGKLFVNVTLHGQPLHGEETEKYENLKMSVLYKDDAGYILDVSKLKQGTDFTAEVVVEHSGMFFPYNDLALSQVFPSGWEIINTRVQEVGSGPAEDPFEYRDFRDDRVYTFFGLDQHYKKTFRVGLNAAYTGKYYLPAVNCEAMYENDIHANNKGLWVEVVR